MFGMSFLFGSTPTYVMPTLPPREILAPMAEYVGMVIERDTLATSKPSLREPGNHVTVLFVVDHTERRFHASLGAFTEVTAEMASSELMNWVKAESGARERAFSQTEKDFTQAERDRAVFNKDVQNNLNAVFAKSRTFWKSWKGLGKIPRSSDDPDGVDASNRQPPDVI